MGKGKLTMNVGAAPVWGQHNLGHMHLTTMDVGRLQVMLCDECVEGDKINLSIEQNITIAPSSAPLQGKYICHTAAYFVRSRVIWDGFSKYRTGMENLTIPNFELNSIQESLEHAGLTAVEKNDVQCHMNSFGIDTLVDWRTKYNNNLRSMRASLLPFRAYERIWYDYFRDSSVIPDSNESSYIYHGNLSEGIEHYLRPHYACWQKSFMNNTLRTPNGDSRVTAISSSDTSRLELAGIIPNADTSQNNGPKVFAINPYNSSDTKMPAGIADSHVMLPANAAGSNINALRSALGLQAYIEKISAIGGRLRDRLRGMFGASVSAETLNMADFIGENSFEITFDTDTAHDGANPEGATNAFGTTNPSEGTIAGQRYGKTTMISNGLGGLRYTAPEAGYIFILSWIVPDVLQTTTIPPMFLRGVEGVAPSRFDFLTDEFVGKGYDHVPLGILAAPRGSGNYTFADFGNYDFFSAIGFVPKYYDYTYHPDVISGNFKTKELYRSMKNWYLHRNLLREAGYTNGMDDVIDGKKPSDIAANITHDTLSQITANTKGAYDENFMYTGAEVDHFVCQAKITFDVVRRLPAAPRVDLLSQSSTSHDVGGNRM